MVELLQLDGSMYLIIPSPGSSPMIDHYALQKNPFKCQSLVTYVKIFLADSNVGSMNPPGYIYIPVADLHYFT